MFRVLFFCWKTGARLHLGVLFFLLFFFVSRVSFIFCYSVILAYFLFIMIKDFGSSFVPSPLILFWKAWAKVVFQVSCLRRFDVKPLDRLSVLFTSTPIYVASSHLLNIIGQLRLKWELCHGILNSSFANFTLTFEREREDTSAESIMLTLTQPLLLNTEDSRPQGYFRITNHALYYVRIITQLG